MMSNLLCFKKRGSFYQGQKEETKLLVRGHGWAEYHADLYEKEEEKLLKAGLDGQCLGGGRIMRTAQKVVVYGYSMGYGRADHQKTVDVIRKHVPSDVEITWNNEGY